jgi:hypothetical protein
MLPTWVRGLVVGVILVAAVLGFFAAMQYLDDKMTQ